MTNPPPKTDDPRLGKILAELKHLRNIDFSGYRTEFLARRLAGRMEQVGAGDLGDYLLRLRNDPREADHLVDFMGINISHFFRDPMVFEILAQRTIPGIIDLKRPTRSRSVRVWSAGCSSGEEAYSVAMLLIRALERETDRWETFVFATDIDSEALQKGRRGVYPRESFAETKLGLLDAFFIPCEVGFRAKKALRDRVHFSPDDLASPTTTSPAESVFGSFDLILCRNLLIYFDRPLQLRVLDKLLNALVPGGFLVLGESEWIDPELKSRLREIDRSSRIFQKIKEPV